MNKLVSLKKWHSSRYHFIMSLEKINPSPNLSSSSLLCLFALIVLESRPLLQVINQTILYCLHELVLIQKCCPASRQLYCQIRYFLFSLNLSSTWLPYSASPLRLVLSMVLDFFKLMNITRSSFFLESILKHYFNRVTLKYKQFLHIIQFCFFL